MEFESTVQRNDALPEHSKQLQKRKDNTELKTFVKNQEQEFMRMVAMHRQQQQQHHQMMLRHFQIQNKIVFPLPAPVVRNFKAFDSNYAKRLFTLNTQFIQAKKSAAQISETKLITNTLYADFRNPSKSALNSNENLVPIRLDIETEDLKIKDAFVWNRNDFVTPKQFALIYCRDLQLPSSCVPQLATSIEKQLEEHMNLDNYLEQDDEIVHVKIEFSLGSTVLKDQFYWSVNSEVTPEEFSKCLCADLGLSGEFVQIVACSIREQVYNHLIAKLHGNVPSTGGYYKTGIMGRGSEVQLMEMTMEEIRDIERLKEREARRLRRESSRRYMPY